MMNVFLFMFVVVVFFSTFGVRAADAAYSPPGFCLDMWYIEEGEIWHQFHLNGPHPSDFDKPWPPLNQPERGGLGYFEQSVFHSISKDLISWQDIGVAITIGLPDQWDGGKIASGNMVKFNGRFYLFYPALRPAPLPDCASTPIGLATSDDLIHWEKYGDKPVLVPDGVYYEDSPMANWRDCNFLWDENEKIWYTVICATAKGEGPIESRGCIALAKSADLLHWECLPPLMVTDRYRLGPELPFLFKHGDLWYLGHSMYSAYYSPEWLQRHPEARALGGVHYLVSKNRFGPFERPKDGGFLGAQPDPPPYAMQLIEHRGERLFMHWGPCRYATALPKKVSFAPDGQMQLVYWPGVEVARKESLLSRTLGTTARLVADEMTSLEIGASLKDCFFEGEVSGKNAALGFAFGESFLVSVNLEEGVVQLLNPSTHEPRADRVGSFSTSDSVRIRLVADGSVIDVYANDNWMFAEHCPRPEPYTAKLIALRGETTVKNLRLDRLLTGNTVHHYGFNY